MCGRLLNKIPQISIGTFRPNTKIAISRFRPKVHSYYCTHVLGQVVDGKPFDVRQFFVVRQRERQLFSQIPLEHVRPKWALRTFLESQILNCQVLDK